MEIRENEKSSAIFKLLVAFTAASLVALSSATGPASVLILILIISTTIALFSPIVIPATVLLFSPLLGRIDESIFGDIGGMEILAAWFLLLGGFIIILNFRKAFREKYFYILILLSGLALLSVFISDMKFKSLTEVIRILSSFIMLPLAFTLCDNQKKRKVIFISILVSLCIPLTIGLYQKLTGDVDISTINTLWEKQSGFLRIYSTFWDVHPFAKYLMMVLPLLLLFTIQKQKSTFHKIFYLYVFSLTFIELIFTYARSELIGFFIALVVTLFVIDKLNLKIILLALPFVVFLFYISNTFERFADIFQPINLQSAARENSLESRILLWIKGFPMALQSPFWGHGADTFEDKIGLIAHNDYLGLFFDIGIGGPILYLTFLFMSYRKSLRISKSVLWDPIDRAISLAAVGTSVAIAIVGIAENLFKATIMWWFYLALLGCTLNIDSCRNEDRETDSVR